MTADLTAAAKILQSSLTSAVAAELTAATVLRHELHRRPDLSGAESATAAAVATAMGFPDAPEVAGTGRLIRIGPSSGPCTSLR